MPLKLQILSEPGAQWVGWCKTRLFALTELRKKLGSFALQRSYILPGNITAQVLSSNICDIIRIWGGELAGVILHPRSGVLSLLPYMETVSTGMTAYGVIGGWKDGITLLETEYLYPLDDTDNASFIVSSDGEKDDDGNTILTGEFAGDASLYGNLYWINGDSVNLALLSWRGPPTRHFCLPSDTNIPGFSVIEGTVERQFDIVPEYSAFGTALYQAGEVLLDAPRYNWPTGGLECCLILGAMQNVAGPIYIATQSDRRNAPAGVLGPGFFLVLWKTAQEGDEEPIVDGWKLVSQVNYGRHGLPWFGNASGTEFVCGNGDRLTAEGILTYNNSGSGSYAETMIGPPDNSHWNVALEYTGETYFEFIGDVIAKVGVDASFSAAEEASVLYKEGKTYTSNLPGLFALESAEARTLDSWSVASFDVNLHYPDVNATPDFELGSLVCIDGQPMVLLEYTCGCNYHSEGYLAWLAANHLPAIEASITQDGDEVILLYWTWDSQPGVCEECPNVAQRWRYGPTPDYGFGTPELAPCGETPYYEITKCDGTILTTGNIEGYAGGGIGPLSRAFNQTTDYIINFGGIEIPIVKTRRSFSYTLESTAGEPLGPVRGIWMGNGFYGTFCDGYADSTYLSSISEDCIVEKCTLHYLDHRHGVLLYRYVRENLVINETSSEYAKFNGTWGGEFYWKIKLKNSTAIADCIEEWRLIINGVETVLSSVAYQKCVFSGTDNIGDLDAMGCGSWEPDLDVGLQIIFPQPDLESSSPSADEAHPEYYCDVLGYGFYKSGVQYSRVNYFYPDWCKALQTDPFWLAAETSRDRVVFDQFGLTVSNSYVPPEISVDPIPIGSYANHPAVGEFYQWLTRDRNGVNKVTTSPDLTALLDAALPEGMKTHDTTLYYPISLV